MNTDEHGSERTRKSAQDDGSDTGAEGLSRIDAITKKIIGCAYQVSNVLGAGFLEKVYENALAVELRQVGLRVTQQYAAPVFYKSVLVGDFVADLLVEDCVVVELKAVKNIDDVHVAQCLNYLKATNQWVCLLINFGRPRLEFKRIVLGEPLGGDHERRHCK